MYPALHFTHSPTPQMPLDRKETCRNRHISGPRLVVLPVRGGTLTPRPSTGRALGRLRGSDEVLSLWSNLPVRTLSLVTRPL